MITGSCNCVICANEFEAREMQAISSINSVNFMICQGCLDKSDPAEDYNQARSIVNSYLKICEAKSCFQEAKDIIDSLNK